MPILPTEPDRFPDDLFALHPPEAVNGRAWWVLHTFPRQEKSLARQLRQVARPFYLPTIHRPGRLRGRIVTSHVPLFAGYLFVLATREDRFEALTTNRVVRALPVADQDGLWRDLRHIERLIASGAPVTPEDRLGPGATVEIRSGPLAGLVGTIVRTASGRRFIVRVDFIQRGASVLLDDFALVPVATGGG